jgi:hypothetical protein
MPVTTGRSQWFAWDYEPASGWKWAGGVNSGGPSDGFARRKRTWIGGRKKSVPGRTTLGGSVELDVTADSVPLMEIAVPTAGVLSTCKMSGYTGHRIWVHGGCYISEMTMTLAVDECLKANLTWMSLPPYDTTAAPITEPSPVDDATFEDWAAYVTIDGVGTYEVQSAEVSVNNLAEYWNSIKARSVGELRGTDGIVYGAQECTADLEVLIPPDIDIVEDCPDSPASLIIECGNPCSTSPGTLTITVPNLVWAPPAEEGYQNSETGLVTWKCSLEQSPYAACTIAYV